MLIFTLLISNNQLPSIENDLKLLKIKMMHQLLKEARNQLIL